MTKIMKLAVALTVSALALCGCSPSPSIEQQCLDSYKIKLTDPDSGSVVKNLGKRGFAFPSDWFFLRIKSKNAFGAYVSSNVICSKMSGETKEDTALRAIFMLQVMNECTSGATQKWQLDSCAADANRFIDESIDDYKKR